MEENLPPIIRRRELWWDPKLPDQRSFYRSSLTLNDEFFREIIDRPVPVDMRAMRELARMRSVMAMDVYAWLTYRFSYLKRDAEIPWALLQGQFGADYARTRDFRAAFRRAMRLVRAVYPAAKVVESESCLVLRPSRTHIPMLGR